MGTPKVDGGHRGAGAFDRGDIERIEGQVSGNVWQSWLYLGVGGVMGNAVIFRCGAPGFALCAGFCRSLLTVSVQLRLVIGERTQRHLRRVGGPTS